MYFFVVNFVPTVLKCSISCFIVQFDIVCEIYCVRFADLYLHLLGEFQLLVFRFLEFFTVSVGCMCY